MWTDIPARQRPVHLPLRQQGVERVNLVDGRSEARDERLKSWSWDLGLDGVLAGGGRKLGVRVGRAGLAWLSHSARWCVNFPTKERPQAQVRVRAAK